MLAKLFKHEWLQTWKVPTLTCAVSILFTLIGALSFHTSLWGEHSNFLSNLMGIGLLLLNIFLIAMTSVVMYLYFSIRFYKNLYSNEGYLMHTLPVTATQLIASKFWIFFLWDVINIFLMIFCYAALFFSADLAMGNGFRKAICEIFNILTDSGFSSVYGDLNSLSVKSTGLPAVIILLLGLLYLFVTLCHSILTPYFAISIGQLFSRYKLGASVGFYVIILILQQFLTTVILLPVRLRALSFIPADEGAVIRYFYTQHAPQYLLQILITGLFCLFIHRIMKKHLNLN